jgi:phosphoribosylformimino-5-aminoimidazole carboxamide ribonucleotide (ProFAR) isomerase
VVCDEDAAAGSDSNENERIMDLLLDKLPCRLAGGFTTNARVYDWLDKGASQVVVEYAASNLGFLDGVPKVLHSYGSLLSS